MVHNFVRGILKDDAAAEDVAQNIFMKLWINRHSLDKNLSLKNYLCVLARNEAINVLRSKHSKNTALTPQQTESLFSDCSVDNWYGYVETSERMRKQIEAMPNQRREIFKMSRYDNMSNMEIAIRLNLSVRTVEKHIELALKNLRRYAN